MKEQQSDKITIMAVASFGGHWLQLKKILSPLEKQAHILYVGASDRLKKTWITNIDFVVRDFSRKNPFVFFQTAFQVFRIIKIIKPTYIITTGAAPGLATIVTAKLFRNIKTLWIDSVANTNNLSSSGKIARFIANKTASQWEEVAERYKNVEYCGNPFKRVVNEKE